MFVVNIGGVYSSERKILAGVPQGSVLSLTLYAIYISDLKLLKDHTYIIGHYNASVRVINLASHTTYVVSVNFIHRVAGPTV